MNDSASNDFASWEELARLCPGGVFGKALGAEGPNGSFVSHHNVFSRERGRLCWDAGAGSLVKVVDWEKTEYWGERVLIVGQFAPRHARGLRWSARQTRLIELSEPLQKLGLDRWLADCEDNVAEQICQWFASAWQSSIQADEMEAVVQRSDAHSKPKSL